MNVQLLVLGGRATKDAEEFTSKAGKKFVRFSMAVNEYKTKTKEEKVTYYDVLIFGARSEKAKDLIKKGDFMIVQGKPEVSAYISKKDNEPKGSVTVVADTWNVLK